MKSILSLTELLALAASVAAVAIKDEAKTQAQTVKSEKLMPAFAPNTTNIFAPILSPHIDTQDNTLLTPQTNISLYYASNLTTGGLIVNHNFSLPAVNLEEIASVSSVDCTPSSVSVTFNNTKVFEIAKGAWGKTEKFIFITNHLGDCDPELERSFFVVDGGLRWDDAGMVVTAGSSKSNVSEAAASTEIHFGSIPGRPVSKRTVIDPSYTIHPSLALSPDTVLYSYPPYITVKADTASFTSSVTLSGYLRYNWLSFSVTDLYFDIDAGFTADLAISAEMSAAYDTTFSYAPAALAYGLSIPGILELAPSLQFSVDARVMASAKIAATAEASLSIADGKVHVDLLDESNTGTSGWNPTYTASAHISGDAMAEINPAAVLTVEIAVNFFDGLLDLSSGLTAKPGFTNEFVLSAGAGVDLHGVQGVSAQGTCEEGLLLDSEFAFSLEAFVTQYWKKELYSVEVPIVDKCFAF